ncbi:ATP-dependent DNA helicase RecG [Peptoniphilus sp. ING2-D1G]|nr:ATP-dependent DNA helicase RecG [Peptoniphilus sp. ING2-D1G]
MKLKDSIRFLKGVGPKREKYFNEIGIFNLEDLLTYYPRDYEDKSEIKKLDDVFDGEKATFAIEFKSLIEDRRVRKNLHLLSYAVEDDTSVAKVTFFNNKFIKNKIELNKKYIVTGRISTFRSQIQISSPVVMDYEVYLNESKIHPIYPQSRYIKNNDISKLTAQVIDRDLFYENIPKNLIDKYKLMDKNESIKNVHRPKDRKSLQSARRRLIFEELLLFQLKLLSIKKYNKSIKMKPMRIFEEIDRFIEDLPFKLTDGQQKAIGEIFDDLTSGYKMNRLVQGDVGSGKTVVAIAVMYLVYLNGYQSAIMVPTEILARQHLDSFRTFLEPLGLKIELLVGSTKQKNRDRILRGLKIGEVDIVIGTHSLLNEEVLFNNLGITVTDEQHRFGVKQREALNTKIDEAHTLVMTATPIPRTLSLILYNDLDISIIDSLPPGRQKIKTVAINKLMLNRVHDFIKKQIDMGHQAYIISPLIEENENLDLNSVDELYENLSSDVFKNYRVAFLHGKLKNEEKDKIMQDFKDKKIDIIISTTVIEVGVNIENATVILIYNAQMFGLAQLHQLRGRVGRSSHKSYCILYNSSNTKISWMRMRILEESNDGFYIANKDLELRGSGDIFGTEQSGFLDLKIADFKRDVNILKYAHLEATNILEEDPKLKTENNKMLAKTLKEDYKVDISTLN